MEHKVHQIDSWILTLIRNNSVVVEVKTADTNYIFVGVMVSRSDFIRYNIFPNRPPNTLFSFLSFHMNKFSNQIGFFTAVCCIHSNLTILVSKCSSTLRESLRTSVNSKLQEKIKIKSYNNLNDFNDL